MHHTFNVRFLWLLLLAAISAFISYGLACVMPFAALAAVAALNLRPRDALLAVTFGWLANQAIGFGLLDYPTDAMTIAWGLALGLSAYMALLVALAIVADFGRQSFTAALLTLGAAIAGQQGVVALANLVLTSHPEALSLATFLSVVQYNAIGFGALLLVQFIGSRANLTTAPMLFGNGR